MTACEVPTPAAVGENGALPVDMVQRRDNRVLIAGLSSPELEAKRGLPIPQALVQTILHTGLRDGDGAPVTDTVEQLLDRPPRSIETYIADHLELFR